LNGFDNFAQLPACKVELCIVYHISTHPTATLKMELVLRWDQQTTETSCPRFN